MLAISYLLYCKALELYLWYWGEKESKHLSLQPQGGVADGGQEHKSLAAPWAAWDFETLISKVKIASWVSCGSVPCQFQLSPSAPTKVTSGKTYLEREKNAGQIEEERRKKVRNIWEHQGQRRRGQRCSRHHSSDSPQPMEDPGWNRWRLPEGNRGPQKAHTDADLSWRINSLCGDTTLDQGKNEGVDERSYYELTPSPRSPPVLHCSGMGWERKGLWS